MKIKKGFLFLLLMLFGVGVLVRYALRDINLDIDLLRESLEKMPGLVLENLEFEREISGDLWQVQVPFAERHDGTVEVRSVDVRRWFADGKEWYFRSARGLYREKEGSAELSQLLGTLETDTRVLNLESQKLSWSEDRNEFLFPKGFTIYDDEFILKTDSASIDEAGVILLDKGGIIRWTRRAE